MKIENITDILCEIKNLLEQKNPKEILSFREACRYLDISASQLYKLTSSNRIEYYKPAGKKVYFQKAHLDQWMLSNPQYTSEKLAELQVRRLRKKNRD